MQGDVKFAYDAVANVGYLKKEGCKIVNSVEHQGSIGIVVNYGEDGSIVGFQMLDFAEFMYLILSTIVSK